jgi:undecaprenyl-diphosphatase
MGLLQGASELFPVSSLGHAVLVPSLLHWSFKQSDPSFVPFLTLLHIGTATALLILYRDQWVTIIRGFFTAAFAGRIRNDSERLAMLLLVGTIPAAILGVFLESRIKTLFGSPYVAAAFLVANGLLMIGFELLRRRRERGVSRQEQEAQFAQAERISFRAAAIVGACQALAFLPGISRSGVTIGGGLVAGLRHQEAARFSFLLATPIIGAAALLKLPDLAGHQGDGVRGPALVGALCAALTAWLAVRFLMRYFETNRLTPFAAYCVIAGIALSVIFALT